MKATGSAQELMGLVQRLTINGPEVEARIEAMLEGHEVQVTGSDVTWAVRNLGKKPGAEVAVGSPTEPMDDLGYPAVR